MEVKFPVTPLNLTVGVELPFWFANEDNDHVKVIMNIYCSHFRKHMKCRKNLSKYIGCVERVVTECQSKRFVTHDRICFYNSNNCNSPGYLLKSFDEKYVETEWNIDEGVPVEEYCGLSEVTSYKMKEIDSENFFSSHKKFSGDKGKKVSFLYCQQNFRKMNPLSEPSWNYFSTRKKKRFFTFYGRINEVLAELSLSCEVFKSVSSCKTPSEEGNCRGNDSPRPPRLGDDFKVCRFEGSVLNPKKKRLPPSPSDEHLSDIYICEDEKDFVSPKETFGEEMNDMDQALFEMLSPISGPRDDAIFGSPFDAEDMEMESTGMGYVMNSISSSSTMFQVAY